MVRLSNAKACAIQGLIAQNGFKFWGRMTNDKTTKQQNDKTTNDKTTKRQNDKKTKTLLLRVPVMAFGAQKLYHVKITV